MKKITLSLLSLMSLGTATPAFATSDLMVAATMQRCATDQECVLVTNSCNDNCGFVPVNKENMPALESLYQSRCGKPMGANPVCNMNPPLAAACINSRCTIDYAYKNNADARDYKPGAYPVPEAPVPSKVPAADYKGVDDTKGGFTAYNLPNAEVKQNSVGTLTTKIYVPPSAPVSGGSYVPVGAAPAAPATAPAMPAPVPAPVAAPAPVLAPVPTPGAIPPAAVPTTSSYATPPVMTPSKPNQLPPVAAPAVPATPTYVPPPAPATSSYVPPTPVPGGPVIPAVGATGVPQAPPGSTPIPPSDLQPAPTFVPPTGTAIPVAPEDPGAPPPEGTKIMMKGQPGSEGMVPMDEVIGKGPKKTFSGTTSAKIKSGANE